MNWRWVAVALFAITAGCGGFTAEPTPSVTPAPVPEVDTTSTPEPGIAPGLTPRGVQDADTLAAAHLTALRDRSYVWRVEEHRSSLVANTTVNSSSSKVLWVESERQYRYWTDTRELRQNGDDRYEFNVTEYVEGNASYQRYSELGQSGQTYERSAATDATRAYGRTAAGQISIFLDVPEATVVATERDGQQYYHLSAERDSIPELGAVPNATVEASISSDGFVRSLNVTYQTVTGQQTELVHYRYAYEAVGNTTVERPSWVASEWTESTRETVSDG